MQVWSVEEIDDRGSSTGSDQAMSECGLSEVGSESTFSEVSYDSSDNASDSGGYASDGSSSGYASDASSGYASSDGEGGGRPRSTRRRSIVRAHPLHHAASSGDIEGVRRLLAAGEPINGKDSRRRDYHSAGPRSPFSRRFNRDRERVSAK